MLETVNTAAEANHWAHGLPLPMVKVSYWKKLQTSYYSQVWSCRRASTENWYSLLIFVQFSKSLPWKTASHSQNEDSKMCAGQFGGWDLFFWPFFLSWNSFYVDKWGSMLKMVRTACVCGRFSSPLLPLKHYRSLSNSLSVWLEGQRHQSDREDAVPPLQPKEFSILT